jgi:hypothetical protein
MISIFSSSDAHNYYDSLSYKAIIPQCSFRIISQVVPRAAWYSLSVYSTVMRWLLWYLNIIIIIGSVLQKVLHRQWCVELWYGAVWDLVSWEEAIFKTLKQSSSETTPNWSLSIPSPWMSKIHLQTDGRLLVLAIQLFVCNVHESSTQLLYSIQSVLYTIS